MTDRFAAYLAEHRREILELLVSLVETNSHTGNRDGVNRVGDMVAAFLADLGFEHTRLERHSIGDHRLFTRGGTGKEILLSCHLDTVFPPSLGFERCVVGDPLSTGPGVIDMKGGIVVLLHTLKMLDQLGLRPASRTAIFFSSDEETGSEDARELVERLAVGKHYGLVFECGGAHGEVVSARKGVGTVRIDIEGKAAHAGNDYARGINANLEAAHKLIAIQALTQLDIGTTVNVGQVSGGIGANTISPSAELVVDVRYVVPAEAERIVDALAQEAAHEHVPGARSRLGGRIQRPVMVETEATRAFVELVRAASGGQVAAEHRGGVGDANFIAALGVPTLDGFGPSGGKDHTVEEHMVTASLFERIELLGRVLPRLDS
jgi:glutamate carboxypeptidase